MQEIIVYTTNYCPYCTQAKQLIKQSGYDFKEIDLSNQPELRQKLSQENNGYRTVPMIFVGQTFIGGFTDLALMSKNGKFKELVES